MNDKRRIIEYARRSVPIPGSGNRRAASHRRVVVHALALALIFLVATTGSVLAQDEDGKAYISDLKVYADGLFLVVDFDVKDAFTKKIEEGIQAGIPTTFTYVIQLRKVVPQWSDEIVYAVEVKRTISYDTLKQEYSVSSGSQDQGSKTKDLQQAREMMARIHGVPLVVKHVLQPGGHYYIEVKAELRSVDLPPFLDSLLFFVGFWDIKTDWSRIDIDPSLWSQP